MRSRLTAVPIAIVLALALLQTVAMAQSPCRADYCAPTGKNWNATAKDDSKTPGEEPLNVIISAQSNVSLSEIKDALGDWGSGCISPETADVAGRGPVDQEEAWRSAGCAVGNIASLTGDENHVRLWHQPIDGSQGAWFITASLETACVVVDDRGKKIQKTLKGHKLFALRHPRSSWHCVDGGPGSFGVHGYDFGASDFVADLKHAADGRGWDFASRLDPRPAGTGLDGVKYDGRVYVVTITKKGSNPPPAAPPPGGGSSPGTEQPGTGGSGGGSGVGSGGSGGGSFPTSASVTYNGYEDAFENGYGGLGADITAVFTPTYACGGTTVDPDRISGCHYAMSGVTGTLFGNTAGEFSGGVPCSVTITPTIEQWLSLPTLGEAGIELLTSPDGQPGTGGSLGFDFFVYSVPPEVSYCDAGINVGTPEEPWSPGTQTSTWPLGDGAWVTISWRY